MILLDIENDISISFTGWAEKHSNVCPNAAQIEQSIRQTILNSSVWSGRIQWQLIIIRRTILHYLHYPCFIRFNKIQLSQIEKSSFISTTRFQLFSQFESELFEIILVKVIVIHEKGHVTFVLKLHGMIVQ